MHEKFLIICGCVAIAVGALLVGCSSDPSEPTKLDEYEELCHAKGGEVYGSKAEFWYSEYKCVGDTPIELLPRIAWP